MKKGLILLSFVLLLIAIMIFARISKQDDNRFIKMAIPEYPLKYEFVSEILEESDFGGVIEEHSLTGNANSFRVCSNENNEMYISIKSQNTKEQRMLGMTFYKFNSKQDINEEECKRIIILGTRLFGGFKDEFHVYNQYIEEIDLKKKLSWHKNIEDIQCEVEFEVLNNEQGYIMKVGFIEPQ